MPVPVTWGHGQIAAIVEAEDGYLAIGNSFDGGVVWTSDDGLAWDQVETGDTFNGAQLSGVIRTDDGYVAVGDAAVWRSTDGQTWRQLAPLPLSGGASINDIAFANGRYVAVGYVSVGGASSYFELIARAWVSQDAEHWTPAAGTTWDALAAGDLSAVVAGGPGFVATGRARGVWTSPDGDVWTQVAIPKSGEWSNDVVVGRDGRIVVAGGAGVVRVSDDAVNWTELVLPGSLPDGYEVTTLVAPSWGYAAMWGTDGLGLQGLWTSADGRTWVQRGVDVTPSLTLPNPHLGSGYSPTLLSCGDALIIAAYPRSWALPAESASQFGSAR